MSPASPAAQPQLPTLRPARTRRFVNRHPTIRPTSEPARSTSLTQGNDSSTTTTLDREPIPAADRRSSRIRQPESHHARSAEAAARIAAADLRWSPDATSPEAEVEVPPARRRSTSLRRTPVARPVRKPNVTTCRPESGRIAESRRRRHPSRTTSRQRSMPRRIAEATDQDASRTIAPPRTRNVPTRARSGVR